MRVADQSRDGSDNAEIQRSTMIRDDQGRSKARLGMWIGV